MIVARDQAAADAASQTLRTLGYHEDDKSMNVVRGEIGNLTAHTVIFFQPPVTPAELQRIAMAKPVQVVALTTPGEVASYLVHAMTQAGTQAGTQTGAQTRATTKEHRR